jgi:hypothetical protein
MEERATIDNTVLAALREYNERAAPDEQLPLERSTVLLGDGGCLDSLGLINLVSTVERRLCEQLGREVIVLSEEDLCRGVLPVSTVGSLMDHVCEVTRQC